MDYSFDRPAYMMVSRGSQNASASDRLGLLSRPKDRGNNEYREITWGQPFPVSPGAKKAVASERLDALAESKRTHTQFRDERPVQWNVDDGALKAIATVRLQQLSRPRSRTMINDDFDPYKIAPGAKKAKVTPRIEELAVPIQRKVRTKKVAAS